MRVSFKHHVLPSEWKKIGGSTGTSVRIKLKYFDREKDVSVYVLQCDA